MMRQTLSLWMLTAILFAGITWLTSCSHNEDDYRKPYDVTDEDRVKYAEEKLGVTFDPEQDWILTNECSVTVNADAGLEDISMVAVLDGNPYAGVSQILASQAATRDAKATLSFRAPQGAEYLYAACLNSAGKCIVRPFVPGQVAAVTFRDDPATYNASVATRAPEMEIVSPPTYANFLLADFPIFRKALLENLPDKEDNRSKLKDASCVIRVRANDYNFYELPLVFLGGIGRDNNASDNDNLAYYWGAEGSEPQAFFLLKDRFKNAFQPKYDKDTKMYIMEGMYPVAKGQDGKNTTQFSANDVLDLQLADGEVPFSHNEIRVKVFSMNDYLFAACEDGDDWDYNDRLFWFPYGDINVIDAYEPFDPTPSEPQTWTYAWEDKDFGDYDLNDCVIEVQENAADKNMLDITLVALGGARELWLGFENRSAKTYADYLHVFEQELHAVLGIPVGQMANTGNGTLSVSPVKVTLPKPVGFNFQTCSFILGARVPQEMRGVYESDYYAISIPKKGQDPHGVAIPSKWQWPTETTSITNAYPQFAAWAHDIKNPTYKNWYMSPEAGKVVNK